jgi:hypothetical protein
VTERHDLKLQGDAATERQRHGREDGGQHAAE